MPYSLDQFVPGQWIIWARTNSKNETQCVRWQWEKVGAEFNTHTIVGIYSPDCKIWPQDKRRVIKYSPRTGKVEIDRIIIDDSAASHPNELKTIYDHLYGSSDKVNFVEAAWLVPGQEQSLPTFAVVGKAPVYLNRSGHAFHGVALQWTEKEDEITWKYQVLKAAPELPFQK
jgi:hypothetical protein